MHDDPTHDPAHQQPAGGEVKGLGPEMEAFAQIGRTLLAQRRFVAITLAAALGTGVLTGQVLGGRVYHSSTSLLYERGAYQRTWDVEAPPPNQLIGLIESEATYDAALQLLPAGTSRQQLMGAVQATLDRDSGFVRIDVDWDAPRLAQQAARAVRDAFTRRVHAMALRAATQRLRRQEDEASQLSRSLDEATGRVERFLSSHHVTAAELARAEPSGIELEAHAQAVEQPGTLRGAGRAESDTVQTLRGEVRALDLQLELARAAVGRLQAQVSDEEAEQRRTFMSQVLITRARERQASIEEDTARRRQELDVARGRLAWNRLHELRQRGLVSQEQYETAAAEQQKLETSFDAAPSLQVAREQERAHAMASLETPLHVRVAARGQLDLAEERVRTLRDQRRQLGERLAEQVRRDESARLKARERPRLQREYQQLARARDAAESAYGAALPALRRARRVVEVGESSAEPVRCCGFVIESEAPLPGGASRSRAHLVTLMVTSLLGLAGLLVALYRGGGLVSLARLRARAQARERQEP